MNDECLSADIHYDNITQEEVVAGKHTETKNSDRKSGHSVNNQSVDAMNMNTKDMDHEEKMGSIRPSILRMDMKSNLSTEFHAVSIARGEVVEGKHTETKESGQKSDNVVRSQSVDKMNMNIKDINHKEVLGEIHAVSHRRRGT